MFQQRESYKHLYSKKVIAQWITEKLPTGKYFIFDWVNGQIREEYPIWSRKQNDQTDYFGINPVWETLPEHDQMISRGFNLEAVIDLVIIDRERIKYGIEVVHTHPTPTSKCELLSNLGITCYEVSADWVMNQIRRPAVMVMHKITN